MADMDELALAAGGDGLEDELLELNETTDNGADNGANDASVTNDSVDGDTSMDDPVRRLTGGDGCGGVLRLLESWLIFFQNPLGYELQECCGCKNCFL